MSCINWSQRPSMELQRRYRTDVATDTPFRSWCRLQQSIHRESRGWPCGEGGREERPLGSYLPPEADSSGWNFLSPAIHQAALDRLAHREPKDMIEKKRLLRNMLTSQALCFNLFLPQAADLPLATAIWSFLLPDDVASVECVKVEHSPGRGHPTLGTGDHSAFDAFIGYQHRDGSRGMLAIETKYTEPFSARAGEPTKRIESLAESNGLLTTSGWQALRSMPTQQLWRTHFVAETMRGDNYRHVSYVVLYAERDEECSRLLPSYGEALNDRARAERRFLHLTLEGLVSAAKQCVLGETAAWLSAFEGRYLDWSLVEAKLG
jgi:hypothetical protein